VTDSDKQRPVAEGVFTWPSDEPQLIGSQCLDCGIVAFPAQNSCSACTGRRTESKLLGRRGHLWSFTVQGFEPKTPYLPPKDGFQPYGVGYIELPGEIKVEARLTENDPSRLEIGMPMELVVVPFASDGDEDLLTFAFAPAS
jgi:uncharacterized OB-fold protein